MNEQSLAPLTQTLGDGPLYRLRREIDHLFDGLPQWLPSAGLLSAGDGFLGDRPSMDLMEIDNGYRLTMELPGVDPAAIAIEYDRGVLKISGERHHESDKRGSDYLISERSYGRFDRHARLPTDVDADSIKAALKDGLLTVTMHRQVHAANQARKIPIG